MRLILDDTIEKDVGFWWARRLWPIGRLGNRPLPQTCPGRRNDNPFWQTFETRWVNGKHKCRVPSDSAESQA